MAIFTRHDIKNDAIVTDHIVDGAVTLAKTTGVASATDVARMSCYPAITVGAEAGDAITVTVQLKDVAGANVSRAQLIRVEWACQDADVKFTAVVTGTGGAGDGTDFYLLTNASGLAVLTLTDTTPNYAGTGGLLVTPLSYLNDGLVGFPAFAAITFA